MSISTLQTAEVVPILHFSPFPEQRHFVEGQIIGKSIFGENSIFALQAAEVVAILHFFPLS